MIGKRFMMAGVTFLVSAICLSGGVSAGAADSGASASPDPGWTSVHGKSHWDVDWDDVHSSIRLTEDQRKNVHDAVERAYQQALMPYAKITGEQAKEAARKAEPRGTVKALKLHCVHGNLVYLVHLVKDDQRVLVVVDAGNGKVLVHQSAPERDHPHSDR
ncbi:MAG: PepSY domain-containing protein [Alicyclobacillaceae bacterium]|nr:PepSY domain-containing protein [Alicyclobacillaceae bacterium]